MLNLKTLIFAAKIVSLLTISTASVATTLDQDKLRELDNLGLHHNVGEGLKLVIFPLVANNYGKTDPSGRPLDGIGQMIISLYSSDECFENTMAASKNVDFELQQRCEEEGKKIVFKMPLTRIDTPHIVDFSQHLYDGKPLLNQLLQNSTYAIAIHHDRDFDNETDTAENYLGMPCDGIGFSRNYYPYSPFTGRPEWEDAAFLYQNGMAIEITPLYRCD